MMWKKGDAKMVTWLISLILFALFIMIAISIVNRLYIAVYGGGPDQFSKNNLETLTKTVQNLTDGKPPNPPDLCWINNYANKDTIIVGFDYDKTEVASPYWWGLLATGIRKPVSCPADESCLCVCEKTVGSPDADSCESSESLCIIMDSPVLFLTKSDDRSSTETLVMRAKGSARKLILATQNTGSMFVMNIYEAHDAEEELIDPLTTPATDPDFIPSCVNPLGVQPATP